MRFAVFPTIFAAVVAIDAVNAASDTAAVTAIVQALENHDYVGATIDIATMGSCDVVNIASCVAGFAPIVIDCGEAAVAEGKDPLQNLKCFQDALTAIGSPATATCKACIEEGLSIAKSLLSSI
ncbi:hypothetical protein V492_05867 [Pseudogymnoascus sp. VKM F-4246]|nr:hypothetical protein V492_05867 [Pseudogymnoascus sp. VKM F-4246]